MQKKRKILFGAGQTFVFCFLIVVLLFSAQNLKAAQEDVNEFHLTNDFSFTYNSVTGPGQDNSSLTEGGSYLETIMLYGNGRAGEITYDYSLGGKGTDDRNNDIKVWSLTNAYMKAKAGNSAVTIGDTFESFSQYTLTTAVKGGSFRFSGSDFAWMPKLTLVYGLAYPRWDSIWAGADLAVMKRSVYGGRIAFSPFQNFETGLNFVGSEDADPANSFDTMYENNHAYSMDFSYKPIPGLTLSGEAAANDVDVKKADDPASKMNMDGYAMKFKAVGDKDPSRVVLEYEKVSDEYQNPLASVTPDREKVKISWRYKFDRNVSVTTKLLWFQDNLDKDGPERQTDTYKPEIKISWKRPLGRRTARLRLSYQKKIAKQASRKIRDDDIILLTYTDRFGPVSADTSIGYNLYEANGTYGQDDAEFIFNSSLRSRFTAGIFVLKPEINIGVRTLDDDLAASDDHFYECAAGMGIDIPDAGITSRIRAGKNRLRKDTGDNSSKSFASASIYWRPEFLSSLESGMLFINGRLNDFEFSTASENFREKSITAGVSIQF